MATKTRIFVPRIEKAKIDSGAVFAGGGYGYETLGYNPNTYALVTAASAALNVQLEADGTLSYVIWGADAINFAGVYMRNPQTMVAGGSTVQFLSTSSASYAGLSSRGTFYASGNLITQPLGIVTFATQTDKYWQIVITRGSAATAQIAMIFLGTYFDLTRSPNYNDIDTSGFDVQQTDMGMGRVLSRLGISSARKSFTRTYDQMTDAELAILRKAHIAAYGPHVPIVIVDSRDSASLYPGYGRLVRFTQPRLNERRLNPDLVTSGDRWNVEVSFEELAQLPFGRAY